MNPILRNIYLCIPISLRRDADTGFEEAVEECHIVKAEAERDLFDLQVGDLQLTLGVRDDGLDDDVTGHSVTHRFDG